MSSPGLVLRENFEPGPSCAVECCVGPIEGELLYPLSEPYLLCLLLVDRRGRDTLPECSLEVRGVLSFLSLAGLFQDWFLYEASTSRFYY